MHFLEFFFQISTQFVPDGPVENKSGCQAIPWTNDDQHSMILLFIPLGIILFTRKNLINIKRADKASKC